MVNPSIHWHGSWLWWSWSCASSARVEQKDAEEEERRATERSSFLCLLGLLERERERGDSRGQRNSTKREKILHEAFSTTTKTRAQRISRPTRYDNSDQEFAWSLFPFFPSLGPRRRRRRRRNLILPRMPFAGKNRLPGKKLADETEKKNNPPQRGKTHDMAGMFYDSWRMCVCFLFYRASNIERLCKMNEAISLGPLFPGRRRVSSC